MWLKKGIIVLLISLGLFSFLFFNSNQSYAKEEGQHCDKDAADFAWPWEDQCEVSAPFCIEDVCRTTQAGVDGACDEDNDCATGSYSGGLQCVNRICQLKVSCGDTSLNSSAACNNSGTKCFWYAGWYGNNESPKCVSQDDTRWGEACNDTHAGAGCYTDQTCDHNSGTCYYKDQTPPPVSTQAPTLPPSGESTLKICYFSTDCSGGEVCGTKDASGRKHCILPNSLPNGAACIMSDACKSSSCTGAVPDSKICVDAKSLGLGESCSNDQACRQGLCIGYSETLRTRTCEFPKSKKVGESCYYDNVCGDGLICPGYICGKDSPTNTTPLKDGERCEALKPEQCEGGACIPKPSAGHHVCATKPLADNSFCDSGHSEACKSSNCIKVTPDSIPICVPATGGATGTPTDPNRNTCELDDNNDKAFKCLSSAETPSGNPSTTYSSPTSNTGYYSCGSKGGSCFRNDEIYGKRGGLGSPSNSPSTTTAPGQGSPAPSSDKCTVEGKGNVDTAFSKPDGYEGSTCDHKLIGETDPRTAKPGRVYADRYRCTKTGADGTNYVDVLIPSANASCDKIPWLVSPSPTPSICKAYQGQSCLLDSKGNPDNTTGPCCLPDQNLSCVDPQKSGTPTCQFIGGKAPTSTPSAPSTCTPGTKSTGCPCDTPTACGCASTHNPEPSLDDPNKYYCVPFASNLKWCSVTKTTMSSTTDPAVCKGSTPFTTPTPASAGCPNDSNHLCVPTNYCQAGYGPSNDTYANTACADWNPDTPQCYIKGKQALSTCTVTPVPSSTTTSPSPTAKPTAEPYGCPANNGDGRVNSCQATCNGSYPNVRTVGNADCTAAYGTIRGACCTSN